MTTSPRPFLLPFLSHHHLCVLCSWNLPSRLVGLVDKRPLTHDHFRPSCSVTPLGQCELSHSWQLLHSPLCLTITCLFPKVLFASGLEGLVHIMEHCLSHEWAMPTTSTPCRYSMLSDYLLNCLFCFFFLKTHQELLKR